MAYFINTKFGMISSFVIGENYEGEKVTKAKHCMDVREALPFKTRVEAEHAWKRLDLDWWHCILGSHDE
jgi:hypothetical protein